MWPLLRLISQFCTLFLLNIKGNSTKPQPKTTFHHIGRAAALILFALILIFTLGSDAQAPVPNAGRIDAGDACYYEASGIAHINQSPCTVQQNEWAYINLSNKFIISASITASVNTEQLNLLDFQQLKNITKTLREYNTSNLLLGNGTTDSTLVNETLRLYNITDWESLPRMSFAYDSRSWEGATVRLSSGRTNQYRIKLSAKTRGATVKYSWLGNASGLYAELEPVLNATAFNVTGNSDLNLSSNAKCQPNCAQYVDGKLIGAVGNRSNITAWVTHPNSNWQANPTMAAYNFSASATGFATGNTTAVQNGWLNITATDASSNAAATMVIRTGNMSVPPASGVIIHGYVQMPYTTGAGESVVGSVCFVQDFNGVSNSSSQQDPCNLPGPENAGAGSSNEGGTNRYIYETNGRTALFAANNLTIEPYEMTLWINSTHLQVCVNCSVSAGSFKSDVIALAATVNSGALAFYAKEGSFGLVRSVRFTNFTVSNASQFGQPYNLTPATLESGVLNSTIAVTSVTVSNISYYYANGNANFSVFDANHANTRWVSEGSSSTITSITGYGLNGTLIPPTLYIASEYTSFLTQTNVPVTPAPTMQNNGTNTTTIRKGAIVGHAANFTTTGTLTFVVLQHNMTSAGTFTNITIPASGTTFNTTANITILFGNQTNYQTKWYVNTSTEINNTIPPSSYTTSNTAPTAPTISTPTGGSFSTTSTITVTASGDVDNNTITYRYYVNGTFNGSTTATSLSLNLTTEQTYAVNVSAYDGTDDSGNSTQVQFVFDNFAPRTDNGTNINSPGFRTVNWVFTNYSYTEPFNNTQLVRNGTGGTTTNTTANLNSTYFWYNFTSLNNANYTFSAWINDTAGNLNTTTNTSIVIDTTFPTITFDTGSAVNSSFQNRNFILINITSTETNPNTINVTLKNGTNLASSQNFTTNNSGNKINFTDLADGKYNVTVLLSDRAGNLNVSTNRTYTVDTTTPTVGNGTNSDSLNRYLARNSLFLNFTYTETNNDTFTIENATGNFTAVNATATYFTYNLTGLQHRTNYSFVAIINDTAGNTVRSSNITMAIDLALPNVSDTTATPTSITAGNPFTVRITANDTYLNTVIATIAGANYTLTCTTNNCSYVFTTSVGAAGNYITNKFYINDSAGNQVLNESNLIVTATLPTTGGSGGGGGGGGAGGLTTTAEEFITVVVNGTELTAKPAKFDGAFDAYFPTGDGQTTWTGNVVANFQVKNCLSEGGFTCEINPADKTQVKINKKYAHNSFAKTYTGSVTLINGEDQPAAKIPISITSWNLGWEIPLQTPKWLQWLPNLFIHKYPDGKAYPRVLMFGLIIFLGGFSWRGKLWWQTKTRSIAPI